MITPKSRGKGGREVDFSICVQSEFRLTMQSDNIVAVLEI